MASKNKEIIRAFAYTSIFSGVVLLIYQAGKVNPLNPMGWIGLPIAATLCYGLLRLKIRQANIQKDRIDKNWLSNLDTPLIYESMAALRKLPPIEPISETLDLESILKSTPPEASFNAIQYGLGTLHGQYLELFTQIVKTMTHPENQVSAYFESRENARLVDIDLKLENAQDEYKKLLLEQRQKEIDTARNHDERSLLEHSLLVATCALYIAQTCKDPFQEASFLRKKIEFIPDEFLRNDPLILICAFAHDLGKITAFKTYTRSLNDHDIKGQQITSRLPAYLESGELSRDDRFILDNVLGHYHAPSKITVGHRMDSAMKTHAFSLSNRMHRILEIVISADTMAGALEAKAPQLRKDNKLNPLTDAEWLALVSSAATASPVATSDSSTEEFEQQIVDAFHDIATSNDSIFNAADPYDKAALGFTQTDIEFGKSLIFIKADKVIGLIEQSVGEVIHADKVNYVTSVLSKNSAIHNPLLVSGAVTNRNFGGTWAWFVRFYPRDTLVLNNGGFNSLRGDYLKTQQDRKDVEGPYYCVDLEGANEAYEMRFKGVGSNEWHQYAMIVDGMGRGVSCAWGDGKKPLLQDRERLINGEAIQGKSDPAEDELTKPAIPVEIATKILDRLIENIEDFASTPPSAMETQAGDTQGKTLSPAKRKLLKELVASGEVGRGHKADVSALQFNGIKLAELLALSDIEQKSLGISIASGEIRFSR